MANIFAQYWNACTSVMPFIPPSATFRVITAPTSTTPPQYGMPGKMYARVVPAPFICGMV
jgi:hypothetical protein